MRRTFLIFSMFFLAATSTSAADPVPGGLAAFRTHCAAPAANLVIDTAGLTPHYVKDGDWFLSAERVDTLADDMLSLIAAACDPNDSRFIEWSIADRIVETKSAGGTHLSRPERKVPLAKLAGVREVRVVYDERAKARATFVAAGGDHRDWLKRELSSRFDPRLVDEDMRDIMAVHGMPPAVSLADGVLTFGVAAPTQIDMPLDRLFTRVVDGALSAPAGKGRAPAPTKK